MSPWLRVRQVVNWINLSTALGLLLAWAGRATIRRHERGTFLATGYRWGFPIAQAFTLGNVIVTRRERDWYFDRPALQRHEDRHCTQYAFCLGPVMVLAYILFASVSWALSGSVASYNPFERLANLVDGGYPEPISRFRRRS